MKLFRRNYTNPQSKETEPVSINTEILPEEPISSDDITRYSIFEDHSKSLGSIVMSTQDWYGDHIGLIFDRFSCNANLFFQDNNQTAIFAERIKIQNGVWQGDPDGNIYLFEKGRRYELLLVDNQNIPKEIITIDLTS